MPSSPPGSESSNCLSFTCLAVGRLPYPSTNELMLGEASPCGWRVSV